MKTRKFLAIFIVVMLPMALLAHAPKKVNLAYNNESGILSVKVVHPVKNVEGHLIDIMVISVNGEEVKKLEYKAQSSLESHEAEIKLPDLKSGDVISVKANCNKLGSKTTKLEIK